MKVSPRTIMHVALGLRILLASLWSLMLCLAGLWLMIDFATRFPAAAADFRLAGIILLCFGQFVFVAVVADRLWPRASVRITWPVHLILGTSAVGGVIVLAAGLLMQG